MSDGMGTGGSSTGERSVAVSLTERLLQGRRVLEGAPARPTPDAFAFHLARVERRVAAGEPIALVLPAFPAKAPNPAKVLGRLPDAAERLALDALGDLLRDLDALYPPGATLTLCSDGHVFADVVGVSDHDVDAYRVELAAMIASAPAPISAIRLFDLGDSFGRERTPTSARKALFERWGVSPEAIRQRSLVSAADRALVDGIHRFLFEDAVSRDLDGPHAPSRTQIRIRTREVAYEVVRRSDAWSRLVGATFPEAIRLSIHPQLDLSPKIGIALGGANDAWLTPWHGVLVVDRRHGARRRLMRRHEAAALGAVVVEENGRAQYMEIPG